MPLYEYECLSCGARTEKIQRFDDPPLAACPKCGEKVRRMVHAPAVQFKGTGWYVTDYGGKGKGGEGKASSDAADGSSSGGGDKKEAATKETPSTGSKKDE